MSVVSMTKIKILGLSYHKERILNTLHKTGCVQIVEASEIPDTFCVTDEKGKQELLAKYQRATEAVEFFVEQIEKAKDKDYFPKDIENSLGNFFVSYDEFMSASGNEMELNYVIEKMHEYKGRLQKNKLDQIKAENELTKLLQYQAVENKFSDFKSTKFTDVFFGTIKMETLKKLEEFLADYPLCSLDVLSRGAQAVILLVCHKECSEEVERKLTELSFSECPYDYDCTAKERIAELETKLKESEGFENKISKKACGRSAHLRNLKILCDYYKFQLEKMEDSENFRCTQKTFILEGYLPKDRENDVKNAIYSSSNAIFVEFSEPTKDDNPPTLLKNDKVVKQAEFITEMYSVPNYREFDPNRVVFFFFMVFMGVIMADIGYGIIMLALGLFLASRIKVDNGAKRLWNIIAIGGIFTIIFGVLFNSLFGFGVLPFTILPSPVPDGNGTVDLMTILLACLGLGVLQIAVGYACKAINAFRHGAIVDGLLDGAVWVVFFIGFVFAAYNFLIGYLMKDLDTWLLKDFFITMEMPGLIMVGASLLIAALTAGRKEKGFGKFTKGFGAIYGLINIMSDILSYARLFGLLLSGMIIAQTFNDMGLGLLGGGGIGYVAGPLVMVIGHVFNLAMGVLGAYIHDSRLQYIEFFGKFYTGEGNKFTPLGSEFKYIYLTK